MIAKRSQGFLSVCSLKDVVTRVLQDGDRSHTDDTLVFHEQNGQIARGEQRRQHLADHGLDLQRPRLPLRQAP